MSDLSNPSASALLSRLIGTIVRPRQTMTAAIHLGAGSVTLTWLLSLALWLAGAGWLLGQPVGRQAVVDERVRVVEALGGTVSDATYAAWQAQPPWSAYFASGGRTLLLPVVTLLVATGLFLWVRRQAPATRWMAALSVAVHASLVLVLQQLIVTPLHYMRESLTSPFNLAAVFPVFDEGSLPARVLGTIEIFGVWWVLLLAIGAAALTGGRSRTYVGPLVGAYVAVAMVVGGVVALMGGS